ncbi:tRNA-dihydrouridine synthase [Candidatus Saccharibacteria bacterium]|nr:tRNA-dihydrouridine synthase [Candidatus Saccharibacteria bacterium]
MNTFWHNLPKPFFVLAPMEAVSDVVFRHVVSRAARPDVYMSEFTNATGWFRAGDKAIGGRLIKTNDEDPVVAQLWGSDPEAMTALSQHSAKLGFSGIDINMGCPDKSAVKGGGGAGLILTPDIAHDIISAAKTSNLPVSVKTRLGYSAIGEWNEWLGSLLAQDIAVLTVHLRTKKEMSKVPAHFELIPEIIALRDKIAPHTLIVINGDIRDRVHGTELAHKYGVDGIMIGRGIFTNPYAFSTEITPTRDLLLSLLHTHLDYYDTYASRTGRPFETLKRFFKIYIRDFDGASELRDKLMHCTTTADVRVLLASTLDTTQPLK